MKKNPIIRTLAVLFALMLTIGTVFANPSDTYAATKKPTKITLNATSATIGVGAKTTIKVKKVTPSSASKAVTYKSSNKKIATVSKKGVVTGKKAGTATITVTSTKAKKVTAKFKVTVKKLTGVTASGSVSNTVVVAKSKTLKLTPAPTPAELTGGTVSYKIVKKSGVSVAKSKKVISLNKKTGKIKAKKAGTAYVQITYKVGKTTKKQTIKVVVPSKRVTSLSIKASKKTLEIGKTATITATVKPAKATCKLVSYTSSKPSVATVNSKGKVTAKKAGTTTITVKTLDGKKKKTVKITVKKAATSVAISGPSSVQVGSSITLKATVKPSTATQTVTWSTNNKAVATVTSAGKVTGVKAGTATITAKSADGKKTATKKITVTAKATTPATVAVTGVTVDPTEANVVVGKTVALSAKVTPSNATNKTITWSSSDTTVATVANGVVTGVKEGTATITAKSSNGKTATATITVIAEGTSKDAYSLTADGNHQFTLDKSATNYSASYNDSNNFVVTPEQLAADVATLKTVTDQAWDVDTLYNYLKNATTATLDKSQILTSILTGTYGVDATVEQIASVGPVKSGVFGELGNEETVTGAGWWNAANQTGSNYALTGDGTWYFDIPNGPAGAYMVELTADGQFFSTTSQNDAWFFGDGWNVATNVQTVDDNIGRNTAAWPEAGSALKAVITREGTKVSVEYLANGVRYAYAEGTIADLPETIYAHLMAQDGAYTYTFNGELEKYETTKKVTVTKDAKTAVYDVVITKFGTSINIDVTGDQAVTISDIKVAAETASSTEHVVTFTVTKGNITKNFQAVIAKDGSSATLTYAENPAKALVSYVETSTAYTLTIDGTFYADVTEQTGNDYIEKLTVKNNY